MIDKYWIVIMTPATELKLDTNRCPYKKSLTDPLQRFEPGTSWDKGGHLSCTMSLS